MRGALITFMGLALIGCDSAPPPRTITATPDRKAEKAPVPSKMMPILDSTLSRAEAMKGQTAPASIRDSQALVNVRYYSFDQKLHEGQIVINKALAQDVKSIFQEIEASHFPIAKVIPIERYGWSDDDSVKDDNTSGFNYRKVPATHRLSSHAEGRAIDLNPRENPYIDPIRGPKQTYNPNAPGALTPGSAPVRIFKKHGWKWGGVWRRGRDYQHFEKL